MMIKILGTIGNVSLISSERMNSMQKDTIVVTGATGIVGLCVVQHLLEVGYACHVLMRTLPPARHPFHHTDVTTTLRDITTLTEENAVDWLRMLRSTALIHCAAMTDLESCEKMPARAYLFNANVTRILARACARVCAHCIMLSTDYVFDGLFSFERLYIESDPVNPLNHYGKSKLQGEQAVQDECTIGPTTPWAICRTAVAYGTASWTRPDFVQWLCRQLRQNGVVRVANDQQCSPTYVEDLARILVCIVQRQLTGIYHITGNTALIRSDFALKIAQAYSLNTALIQAVPTSALRLILRRPQNTGLSIAKIFEHTGIQPLTVDEGLSQLL